jgi:hypothetical protein
MTFVGRRQQREGKDGEMEPEYDVRIDGYRLGWGGKTGYMAVGFLLGWLGVLIDWGIARRKRMMECSAEAIFLGIIGWALSIVC